MMLKCFYIFIWFSGLKLYLCQRQIALGEESNMEKKYLVYFVKSPYSYTNDDTWLCGGSLVSPRQILTAAACLVEMEKMYAIAGYNKYVHSKDIDKDKCTKMMKQKVVKISVPKEYKLSTQNPAAWLNMNIGVAVVEKPYNFYEPAYRILCSYEPQTIFINFEKQNELENTHAVAFSWRGIKARNPSESSEQDINLKEASTMIVEKETCASFATSTELKNLIDKYLLCTSGYSHIDGYGVATKTGEFNIECLGAKRRDNVSCDEEVFYYRRQSKDVNSTLTTNNTDINSKRNTTEKISIERRSISPGICQIGHGGPLVKRVGLQEMIIGVALNAVYNQNYECVGPFLHVSTAETAQIIKCLLEVDRTARKICNDKINDKRYEVNEIEIKWPEDTNTTLSNNISLFLRQSNKEIPPCIKPTIDPSEEPRNPQLQVDQIYKVEDNQKRAHDQPAPDQLQFLAQSKPTRKERAREQPYVQIYEQDYDRPRNVHSNKATQEQYIKSSTDSSHHPKPKSNEQLQMQMYIKPPKEPIQVDSYKQPQLETLDQTQTESHKKLQSELLINQPQKDSYKQTQSQILNQKQKESYDQPQVVSNKQPQVETYKQPQMESFKEPQVETINSQLGFSYPRIPSFSHKQIQSFRLPVLEPFKPPSQTGAYRHPSFESYDSQPFNPGAVEPYESPYLHQLDQQRTLQPFEQPKKQSSMQEYEQLPKINILREPPRDPQFEPTITLAQDERQLFEQMFTQLHTSLTGNGSIKKTVQEQTFEELYKNLHDPALEIPQEDEYKLTHMQESKQPFEQPRQQPPEPRFEYPLEPRFEQAPKLPFDQAPEPQFVHPLEPQFYQPPEPQFDQPPEPRFEQPQRSRFEEPPDEQFGQLYEAPQEHFYGQQFENKFIQPNEQINSQFFDQPRMDEEQDQRDDDVKVRPQLPLDYLLDHF